jgi:hypothetical protein
LRVPIITVTAEKGPPRREEDASLPAGPTTFNPVNGYLPIVSNL